MYQNDCNLFINQSGFRSRHSTTSAVLNVCEKIRANIDSNYVSILTFLDFTKAFDTVDHALLCYKLKTLFKLSSSACNLIYSYLTDRMQIISVNGQKSEPFRLATGLPQGSVLGPLLFAMFINDLPKVVSHASTYLYADDVLLVV